jgi:hypothetical protein
MNIKQEAIHAIESLPDAINFEEIIYRLYVLEKVHNGQTAISNGNVKTLDQLKQEVANSGRPITPKIPKKELAPPNPA